MESEGDPAALRPEHVFRILELTDSFNTHGEAVIVPLATEDKSSVTVLPDVRLCTVCPKTLALDEWMNDLRCRLEKMDL